MEEPEAAVTGGERRTLFVSGNAMRRFWIFIAFIAVIFLYLFHAFAASRFIDGVLWFWLDDDQMISMRYARNLIEGHGLVWNPGERVEGYTNFGWTMLMAAVHLIPLDARMMPLAMTAVSALICLTVVYLTARLLETLEPRRLALTLPVALFCIVTCTDVMFWATSGFETILVTALHLYVVLSVVRGGPVGAPVLIPLALIPLVRSDGIHVWLGDAILVLWLAQDRTRAALLLLASLLPFAAHLLFRVTYYGDLLPNTYYLKVSDLDAKWSRGLDYVFRYCQRYSVVIILAIGTAASLCRRDPRALSLFTSVIPTLLYSAAVGGDVFYPFRFLAHIMPELFIWATLGGAALVTAPAARLGWVSALTIVSMPSASNPLAWIAGASSNGDPFDQIVVAASLKKNASADASVAAIAAGIVPYFTRLKSIDLLGKNDAHIARLPPQPGAMVGHGKIDPNYSFQMMPDYVVSHRSAAFVEAVLPLGSEGTTDYVTGILASPLFQEFWKPNPVPDPYLLEHSALYVRTGSREMKNLSTWQSVQPD
jgi:hypothetical protein